MERDTVKRIHELERWQEGLALPEIASYLPFAVYEGAMFGVAHGAAPWDAFSTSVGRTMIVRNWFMAWYVVTTNTGAHYWTFTLETDPGGTDLGVFNTSAGAPDTWTLGSVAAIATSIATTDISLRIRASITGTPGNLYLKGPLVQVT